MARKKSTEDEPKGKGTVQTSKGYVTADGTEKVRVSIHLTKPQRRRLRDLAEDAGLSLTDYVVDRLGL